MFEPDLYEQNAVVCAHCMHRFSHDEMYACEAGVWELATDERTDEVQCPACREKFFVHGGYRPHWSSATTEDEL